MVRLDDGTSPTPPSPLERSLRAARALCLFLAAAYVVAYAATALARIGHPFELEWMEGGMVEHVRRLVDGKQIYAEPSLEFIAFLYPPLYYYASAALSSVLGPGFLPLRLISFVCSLGVLALLYALVRRETGEVFSSILAAGLFAATFARSGAWFDLARVDSMFLLLLLAGVYRLRVVRTTRGLALAGLLVAAAGLTKQTALVVLVPLMLYAAVVHRWRSIAFGGVAAVAVTVSLVLLDRASDGWLRYYCFTLPAHHPREPGALGRFWTADLVGALPVACIAASFYLLARLALPGDRQRLFYPLFAAGAIAGSWSARSLIGAETNNLFPAFAAVALVGTLGAHELRSRIAGGSVQERFGTLFVHLVLVGQLALLAYDPRAAIPTAQDRAAGREAVQRIASVPGDVYVPHHGYLARLAGKQAHAHILALDNVILDDAQGAGARLREQVAAAIAGQRFGGIVVESDGRDAKPIGAHYPRCRRLFDDGAVFWPVSGNPIRPEVLCVPP